MPQYLAGATIAEGMLKETSRLLGAPASEER
ncbi:MAG: hypothetical protein QOE52_4321 [Mycobacterium sp.]|jgi:hypothetical protein|nr:hypothetical protein [Mycobacterium sp.]MDT7738328.1 hypothetical protein [Mycobacterium sp.]MDT7767672.1 hypothetical protein [Mycobacterium sp.]